MIVALQFGAAGTQSFTPTADAVLTGGGCLAAATARAVVSSDPNVTAAQFTAPGSNGVDKNLIGFASGGVNLFTEIAFPLLKGDLIYVASSAAGTAVSRIEPTTA